MNEQWKDAQGKTISLMDCVSACQLAVGLIHKELLNNKRVKDNKKIVADYQRKKVILEQIKDSFEQAGHAQQKRREPRSVPVKKRIIH